MVGVRVVIYTIFAVTGTAATGCGFGYDGELGPDHWKDEFKQCAGKHQSPINIDSKHVSRVVLPKLKLQGFDYTDGNATLTNNGHTAMLSTDSIKKPIISGGPLNGIYEFVQFHFHWGSNDTVGSEDEIDGKIYPMELHIVFFKKDYINSNVDPMNHSDGVCVLACFFEVGNVHNGNYNVFDQTLPQIINYDTETALNVAPALFDLMPTNLARYFTYNGSLTTPPCAEVVTWIDFKEPVRVSHDQFQKFRNLKNHENRPMSNNFRAIQPLGDRVVLYNADKFDDHKVTHKIRKNNGNTPGR